MTALREFVSLVGSGMGLVAIAILWLVGGLFWAASAILVPIGALILLFCSAFVVLLIEVWEHVRTPRR